MLVLVSLSGHGLTQPIQLKNQIWDSEVIRSQGRPVIPLFDGWFPNGDGTRSLCYSYFNMNTEESLTIPTGNDNYLSGYDADGLLPTHFDPLPIEYRHKFCVFTVTVPEEFGANDKIYWNLTSANEALKVPGHIKPAYVLDEPASHGRGDIAPAVRLEPGDEYILGRKGVHSKPLQAETLEPLRLEAWVEHEADEVWVGWAKHSGPGKVSFDHLEGVQPINDGPVGVTVTFDSPGEYVVRMQTIEDTDAFEFYCCHTNAYFHVNVSN